MSEDRLPDFINIGAMKSATATLYAWLRMQPDAFLAYPKGTNFFAIEQDWAKGIDWYRAQFADAAPTQVAGESSVAYSSPEYADRSAERMADLVPRAKLIYLVRNPVERIRSHYRHEVQRHRETGTLNEALSRHGNEYIGNSMYFSRLAPYLEGFPREQILVVPFESLVKAPSPGWAQILRFLGLPDRPAPGTAHNVSAEKTEWTGMLLWLKKRGIFSFQKASKLPKPVRKLGKSLLTKGGSGFERKLDDSRADMPAELLAPVWEDLAKLEAWLGDGVKLWSRDATPRSGTPSG